VPAPAKSCDGVEIPKDLPPTHRRVLDILLDHAFFAPTCEPSHELIGEQAGITREWAGKICRDLRDRGLVGIHKVRAPGAKWKHCVYTLFVGWHRPHRKAVIARIRAAKARIRGRALSSSSLKENSRDVKGRREALSASAAGTSDRSSGVIEVELSRIAGVALNLAPRRAEQNAEDRPELFRCERFDGFVAEHVAQQFADRVAWCN
jgi:hypothetical protein